MTGNANKLLILTYHRVIADPAWNDPDEVDVEQFQMHVDIYSRYFNVLRLSDAISKLHNGGLPSRAVSITFDDGYKDNVSEALPILESRGVPATFFIASGFLDGGIMWNDAVIESVKRSSHDIADLRDLDLGQYSTGSHEEKSSVIKQLLGRLKYLPQQERDDLTKAIAERLQVTLPTDLMMSSSDVVHMRDSGMEIGAHTRTHPILSVVSDSEAEAEILGGKRDLEQIIGGEVTSFAYPNGRPGQDYEKRHVEFVSNAGFELAVSTAAGCVRPTTDTLQLGRVGVWHRSRPKLVLRMLMNYFSDAPVTVQ